MAHSQDSASTVSEKPSKRPKYLGSSFLILALGIFLIAYGGINYYQVRVLSFNSVPEAAAASTRDIDTPVEIIIPSVKIDLKIDPGQVENGVWQISGSNATFLATSAPPGSGGNTVIYGHNKRVIFGNLPYLSVGQKIVVKTKNGNLYTYKVIEKQFVGPDRVDLVSPSDHEELTVYTCYGLLDQTRAVVKATPI